MDSAQSRYVTALAERFRATLRPTDFDREDETDDVLFYQEPRFVQHLDRTALETVERLHGALIVEPRPRILDLMASHDSHLPTPLAERAAVTGLGLNAEELAANPALASYVVHDLNRDPALPFADGSFDAVLNTVSIDYLTRPLEVIDEIARVLRPGGLAVFVFSDRMFRTKATRLWRRASPDERVILVEEFVRQALAFESPRTFVSKGLPRPADDPHAAVSPWSDPVFAVYAERLGGAPDRPARVAPPAGPPSAPALPADELARRVAALPHSLRCPHCQGALSELSIPEDAAGEWGAERAWVCFDDACPYFVRGWSVNYTSGSRGYSYRFLYDPERDRCAPLPVPDATALRDAVVG